MDYSTGPDGQPTAPSLAFQFVYELIQNSVKQREIILQKKDLQKKVNCQGKFRFVKVTSGILLRQENQSLRHQNEPENEAKERTKTSLSGYNLAAAVKEGYSKQASGICFGNLPK